MPGCGIEVLTPTSRAASPRHRDGARGRARRLRAQPRDRPPAPPPDPPGFGYDRSLELLRWAKEHRADQVTKSNLIVGMGESEEEVYEAMADLNEAGCDILTIGQYLQPSAATCRSIAGSTPTSSRATSASARRWGSPTWKRDRWSAPAITRASNSGARWKPGFQPPLDEEAAVSTAGLPGGAIERIPGLHATDDVPNENSPTQAFSRAASSLRRQR